MTTHGFSSNHYHVPSLGILILHALFVSSSSGKAYAALTNMTIDDTDAQFWWFVGQWHATTPSTPCSGCTAKADPAQAYNHTWHDVHESNGAFTFQGSAHILVSVFCLVSSSTAEVPRNPPITSFHFYDGNDFVYNSLFFSATGLDSTVVHTVTWRFSDSGDLSGLLDYAVVTVGDGAISSNSGTSHADTPSNSAMDSVISSQSPLWVLSSLAQLTNSVLTPLNNYSTSRYYQRLASGPY
ncbi:hypothetical protein B0H19DRAFT_1275095 [Mycena capillaripes]|nr:hypothetical protein B0H19DRAFT_1275095 [Mycena capillaripes]